MYFSPVFKTRSIKVNGKSLFETNNDVPGRWLFPDETIDETVQEMRE